MGQCRKYQLNLTKTNASFFKNITHYYQSDTNKNDELTLHASNKNKMKRRMFQQASIYTKRFNNGTYHQM